MYWLLLAMSSVASLSLFFKIFFVSKVDYFDQYFKKTILVGIGLNALLLPYIILLGMTFGSDDADIFLAYIFFWIVPSYLLVFILNKVFLPKFNTREYSKRSFHVLSDRKFRIRLFRRMGLCFILVPLSVFLLLDHDMFYSLLTGEDSFDVIYDVIILIFTFAIGLSILVLGRINFKRWTGPKNGMTEKIKISQVGSNKAPIVLLRSFEIMAKENGSTGVDEQLFRPFVLSGFPVISLGDPDSEKYGGSIKFEAKDDKWQTAIELILSDTSAVLMLEGKTDGLNWEISKIKQYIDPKHFFVLTLPKKMRMDCWYPRNAEWFMPNREKKAQAAFAFLWKSFASKLVEEGINVPTDNPGSGVVLMFDENWNVSAKIEYANGDELLRLLTTTIGNTTQDFDYQKLYGSISDFEVKDEMPAEIIKKFRKFSVISRWSLRILAVCSIIINTIIFASIS